MLIASWRPDLVAITGDLRAGLMYDIFEDLWRSYGNLISWRSELLFTRSQSLHVLDQGLIDILNDSRYLKATDPRDHVYAFLAIPVPCNTTASN